MILCQKTTSKCPFGAQVGLYPFKNWTFAPYYSMNWILGGKVITNVTMNENRDAGTISISDSAAVDGYFSPSFGMDVVYEPYNFSLGLLFQTAKPGGDAGEMKTTVIQLFWKNEL